MKEITRLLLILCDIDTLIVEFRQFPKVSNLRRIKLCRRKKEDQNDGIGGYCGGIRKLENEDEIKKWNNLLLQLQVHHFTLTNFRYLTV